ncbi:hypothetical protein MKX01_024813 [Papaver californicum]|nr:hypothetical protein MKX01_024813 [Papaver californicum]
MISRKVAVIGAGAAGVVASRELRREGHEVVVFERSDRVGGTWVYNPNVDFDPLGLDTSRTIIHSSIYNSLRVNLPREVMGFRDYPFVAQVNDGRDPRRFPHHSEVLHYLEDFANHFGLIELIRFETEVIYVGLLEEEEESKNNWVVKSRKKGEVGNSSVVHDVFDAVVVCSGHYTHPNIAEIPGIGAWPGKQLHSHNYRVPEPFSGQVKSAHEDGTVVFLDGSLVPVDVIVHCTGYNYYFPFLEINNIVTVDDNCVGPLYKNIFPPMLALRLSFIGIPFWTLPFPLFELESKWVAGILSGRCSLPSEGQMIKDVNAFYLELEAAAVPKRYTHRLAEKQYDYSDWLAAESGCQPWEEWRKQMLKEHVNNYIARPKTYCDEWEDVYLIVKAQDDFASIHHGSYVGMTKRHSFQVSMVRMSTEPKWVQQG